MKKLIGVLIFIPVMMVWLVMIMAGNVLIYGIGSFYKRDWTFYISDKADDLDLWMNSFFE